MANDSDDTVREVLEETKAARVEHAERETVFDRAYEVYRPKQMRGGKPAQMTVPFAQANLDTALVNIVQDEPRCIVLPRTPDYMESARKFQLVMDYFAERDHLVEKAAPLAQQALIYGITIGKVRWKYETADRIGRHFTHDPVTNERHRVTEKREVVLYDGPTFDVWSPYDAWWDPNGGTVDACAYFCLRSWVNKEHLALNACKTKGKHRPEDCDGIYHGVADLLRSGNRDKQTQTAQERRLKRSQESRQGLYEVVEVWRDERYTVYGNEKVLLRDGPNPHWHGRKPIVTANTRPDVLEMMGVPETELIDHLQQALWTNQRLRFENLLLTVQRMFTYRESSTIDPKKTKMGPRALIGVTDHDDLRPIEVPPLPAEVYREEAELLGRMQLVTGISPWVSGADMQTIDQNTATGINVLSEVAGRLLKFKASQIHYKIWQRMFELWGNDIQQFLDHEIQVRIINEKTGEPGFSSAGPNDVVGEYDFVLAAGGESSSKQQRRSEMLQLLQALGPMVQSGAINIPQLLTRVAETFDFAQPRELINAQPPMPAAAPGPNGQAPAAPTGPGGQNAPPAMDPAMLQAMQAAGVMQGQQGG